MEIQIISGFLGAGKTTFLNKYIPLLGGRTVVIENEFGETGLDGELIRHEGIPVREIYAGCICCSLALDFRSAIGEIAETFHPDRIIIEPSGAGRLSDIIKACNKAGEKDGVSLKVTKLITIVDITTLEEYADCFGAFYLDQIRYARLIFLSHVHELTVEEKRTQTECLKELNPDAILYEGDFRKMEDEALEELIRMTEDYGDSPKEIAADVLPADRVFTSVAIKNSEDMTEEELEEILKELKKEEYGKVLRAKGIVSLKDGRKVHFDYTPSASGYEPYNWKGTGHPQKNRIIIIGCGLNKRALRVLFKNRDIKYPVAADGYKRKMTREE